MTTETDGAPALTASESVGALFRDLGELLKLAGKPAWSTPVLIALGLVASLTEMLGISFVLVFLYIALGEPGQMQANSGMVGRLAVDLGAVPGGSVLVGGIILGLIMLRALLAMIYGWTSSVIAEGISERTRNLVHQAYLSTRFRVIVSHDEAHLLDVVGKFSWNVSTAYLAVTRLVINGCSIVILSLFLGSLSLKILLIAAIGFLLVALVTRRQSTRMQKLGEALTAQYRMLGAHMLITLQAMRTIRAYGAESQHQQRFEESSVKARAVNLDMARLSSMLGPVTEFGYLLVLVTIVAGASSFAIPFPVVLACVAVIYRLQPHVYEFQANLLSLAQQRAQLVSLRTMLQACLADRQSDGRVPIHEAGTIAFEHVTFAYVEGGQPVLTDLSLTVPAGKTVALLGESGAGKSTVVNLLLRLYEPDQGTIRIADQPLDDLRRSDWLGLVAVAGQDIELIEGTVIDNIRLARPEASDADVRAAAERAGVTEFVDQLEYGMESWVGQMGVRFSGGQRQRIGLARAILREPQVLILDEAMSELDIGLESLLRRNIQSHFAGRTIIIITHRIDTVREVDHAIWLEKGRCRAEGAPGQVIPELERTLNSR